MPVKTLINVMFTIKPTIPGAQDGHFPVSGISSSLKSPQSFRSLELYRRMD